MKTGWKDFFYFQQNDKRAILLLLILIFLCLGITLVSEKWMTDKEIVRQQEALDEFENFQSSLTDKKEILTVSSQHIPQQEKDSPKTSLSKLSEGEKIDLNGADIATIKRIPGIGDSFGNRIYDYHNRLGGFVTTEQLMEIEGISPKRYEKILPYIELKNKHRKLKVNSLSVEELSYHPYLTDKQAQLIVSLRQNSKITHLDEIAALKGFSPRDIDRLSAYISFD